jgi:hypothetical protein
MEAILFRQIFDLYIYDSGEKRELTLKGICTSLTLQPIKL